MLYLLWYLVKVLLVDLDLIKQQWLSLDYPTTKGRLSADGLRFYTSGFK
jgi:hypothetical protein